MTLRSSLRAASPTLLSFSLAWPAYALDVHDLTLAADRSNRSLPRMVAKDVRQERVKVTGMIIVYEYTHLTLDSGHLRGMRLDVTQRPFIVPPLCTDVDADRKLTHLWR